MKQASYLILSILIITGCAYSSQRPDVVDRSVAQRAQSVTFATVVDIDRVVIAGDREVGAAAGALIGAAAGQSVSDSEMKLTYDFFYIKNFSFWLDLLIFFKTLRLVFRREGSLPIR